MYNAQAHSTTSRCICWIGDGSRSAAPDLTTVFLAVRVVPTLAFCLLYFLGIGSP